jgi:hypothetical protein
MNKSLASIAVCLGVAISFSSHAEDAASGTRYVWANNLTVRSAPDMKADAIARLPRGASVQLLSTSEPLTHRNEIVDSVKFDKTQEGEPVGISGDWRRVRTGATEGWVFDGYLSRYRYPKAEYVNGGYASQFSDMKKLFGVKSELHWKTGDSTKTVAWQAVPQKMRDEMGQAGNQDWGKAVLQTGGRAEMFSDEQETGSSYEITLDKVPMSFPEALLLIKRWGQFEFRTFGWAKNNHLELHQGPDEMNEFTYTIDCDASTCTIHGEAATE